MTVSEPPSRRFLAAASALRAAGGCSPSRVSINTSASPRRAAMRLPASIARSTAWSWESAEAARLRAAAGAGRERADIHRCGRDVVRSAGERDGDSITSGIGRRPVIQGECAGRLG